MTTPALGCGALAPKVAMRSLELTMKCAIVTPIGPGHEEAYRSCALSIDLAARHGLGPFTTIIKVPIYDLQGGSGRSAARNLGIETANGLGCDWIFFLDADDLMVADAFENVTTLVQNYDAIWGLICEAPHGSPHQLKLREHQSGSATSLDDVLNLDPFLTLQMGHFIKAPIALKIKFDVDLDAGEDFKFYLACWRHYKCIKGDFVLFLNLRGNHSTGPRSADGQQWRRAVDRQIIQCKAQWR